MHHLRSAFLVSPLILALACGGSNNLASQLVKSPEYAPKGQSKCSVKTSQAEPLIVEWPPAERGRLEADLHTGVVAVRYDGCEMKLLPYCKVKESTYAYVPVTRKADSVHIANEDDLFASLPMGAVSLEGKLKEAGSLDVDMTLVGRWEWGKAEAHRGELNDPDESDECKHATHVIAAVTVGAFTFSAGGNAEVGGGVKAFGAGAGGDSTAKKETLSSDGDTSACGKATNKDVAPPDDCGALLRIEVVPIKEGGFLAAEHPSTTGSSDTGTTEPAPSSTGDTASTQPPPVPSTDPTQEPAPVEGPKPFPTTPRPYPTYEPPATTSTPTTYTLTGNAGAGGGESSRGPLGTIIGWSATGALVGGALLGAIGYATANAEVGSSPSNSDCDPATKTCNQAGMDAKSKALLEAGIGDGLMVTGIVLGVVYFLLPRHASTSTTVSVAPNQHGGGSLQLGGHF